MKRIAVMLVAAGAIAACAHAAAPRPVAPIPFAALQCETRDGTATCKIVDGQRVGCCAVQADGTEGSWICPTREEVWTAFARDPVPIADLVGVAQIEPSADHLCALMNDGTVRCVGYHKDGVLAQGTYPMQDAITTIGVWDPTNSGVGRVSVGVDGDHQCALMGDGAIHCAPTRSGGLRGPDCRPVSRGDGVYASCDDLDPRSLCRASPVALTVPGLRDVKRLSGDCALLRDGTVRCWGANAQGAVGTPPSYGIPVPTKVPGLDGVRQVVSNCAVLERDGRVRCWGKAHDRVLDVLEDVEELALSGSGGCARIHGKVRCWGSNVQGEVGTLPIDRETHPPLVVPELAGARQLGLGDLFGCALVADRVLCWGRNDSGELGDGTTTTRATPREVKGLVGVTRIAVSAHEACARTKDAKAVCWGQLPVHDPSGPRVAPVPTPTPIDAFGRVARIAAGRGNICVVTDDAHVSCWAEFGRVDRVTGSPSVVAVTAEASSDDELLPAREVHPDRLSCESATRFCYSAATCFASEDECLDARATASVPTPCVVRRFFTLSAKRTNGQTRWSCTCSGEGHCSPTSAREYEGCDAEDPITELRLVGPAFDRACDANLRTNDVAMRSTQRTRYCANKRRAHECHRSAEACEQRRSESQRNDATTTDGACTVVAP